MSTSSSATSTQARRRSIGLAGSTTPPLSALSRRSLVLAGFHLLLDLLGHRRIAERGHVAELAALRDVLQETPHDLAGARLRQVVGVDEALRTGELADLVGHVVAQLVVHALLLLL